MASARCPACFSKIEEGNFCTRCGFELSQPAPDIHDASLLARLKARLLHRPVNLSYRATMPWRRPLLAAVMSAAVIGSGHFYCRNYKEGTILLVSAIVLTWAVFFINPWAMFFLAVLWQYQIFTAYDEAVNFDWSSIFRADERD